LVGAAVAGCDVGGTGVVLVEADAVAGPEVATEEAAAARGVF